MAIEFLIDFHPRRRWLLTSIDPDGTGPGKIITRGFDPTDPREQFAARIWIISQTMRSGTSISTLTSRDPVSMRGRNVLTTY